MYGVANACQSRTEKVAFDKLKTFRQIGSVSRYVSSFNLPCLQTEIPETARLHYWCDDLKPDIKLNIALSLCNALQLLMMHNLQLWLLIAFTVLLVLQALLKLATLEVATGTASVVFSKQHKLFSQKTCKLTPLQARSFPMAGLMTTLALQQVFSKLRCLELYVSKQPFNSFCLHRYAPSAHESVNSSDESTDGFMQGAEP